MAKKKREWLQIIKGSNISDPVYYLNGVVYTDLDEPLRIALKRAVALNQPMRVWKINKYGGGVMLSTYRTSNDWGKPHTEKLPLAEVWPIFETYARML